MQIMRNCTSRCGRFVVLAAVGVAVAGLVVMGLWNWLTPDLFGWKPIGYLQALGLLVLSRILFGGFRGHGHPGSIHDRMTARLERMTPEQRERLKTGMRSKWCGCGTGNANTSEATNTAE
jgi:hypothetical protein